MARLLIISFSPVARDPRVMRQVRALSGTHAITLVAFGQAPDVNVEYIELEASALNFAGKIRRALRLLTHRYESDYWRSAPVAAAVARLGHHSFDLVLANDVITLPLALRIAADAPVILDAHEYSPREFEDSFVWRLFLQRYMLWLCQRFIPQVHSAMTVCAGIADEYRRQFGVAFQVVHNCPDPEELPVRQVTTGRVRLVHHGIAIRSRRLECMIDMMRMLDQRFTLDLYLVDTDRAYMSELRAMVGDDGRIRFQEPVPMELISRTLNEYDMGLFLLPPINFNYRHALPNKFFEFIQARLAVAIGPSPEMRRQTEDWGIGIVAADFKPETLAAELNALSADQLQAMKSRSALAAKHLHGGVVANQLRSTVDRALGAMADAC